MVTPTLAVVGLRVITGELAVTWNVEVALPVSAPLVVTLIV